MFNVLLVGFIIFNIMDVVTTYIGIKYGCIEQNPVASLLIDNNLWVILKLGLMIIVVIGSLCSQKVSKFQIIYYILLVILDINLLFAAINNIYVLITIK